MKTDIQEHKILLESVLEIYNLKKSLSLKWVLT